MDGDLSDPLPRITFRSILPGTVESTVCCAEYGVPLSTRFVVVNVHGSGLATT